MKTLIQNIRTNGKANQNTVDAFYIAVGQLTIMEQYYMIKGYKVAFNEDYFKFQSTLTRGIIKDILNNLYEGQDGDNQRAAQKGMGNLDAYVELFNLNY